MSSRFSTAVQAAGPLSDGPSSLVLSKKYLPGARSPQLFKLEHDRDAGIGRDGDAINYAVDENRCGDWQPTAWLQQVPSPAVVADSAVHARYEPSDVFTPLVFEEIKTARCGSPIAAPWSTAWTHVQQLQQHSAAAASSVLLQTIRRPLQHLPPPAQSATQLQRPAANKPSSAEPSRQLQQIKGGGGGGGGKGGGRGTAARQPGDLSWLVNFQVASIFEPALDGPAGAGQSELQEPETQRQKKKISVKTEPKTPSKVGRKPYRMPPSRLDKTNKPGYTYTEMIHQALMEKKELPVAEIYQWISSHFPYFREDDERWKNSVRHNLSINPNFRKGRKSQGAGHYWRLCNTEESLGQREYTITAEDGTCSPPESSELEQACKYLEGELQRDDSLDNVKIDSNINEQLENEIFTNSFLISSPPKYVNEPINIVNNHDFHSYGDNLLEEPIDFQYYNL